MPANRSFCPDFDLFGDVVVTLDDVDFWLDEVPKIPRTSHFQGLENLATARENLYVAHRLGSVVHS